MKPMVRFPRSLMALGVIAASSVLVMGATKQAPAQQNTASDLPQTGWLDENTGLDVISGPVNVADLLNLPVRTYGTAPPVSVVDDLLIKADGRISRLVLDNGQFLQMGLDGKRVALPYDAVVVPGQNGKPAFLRINIARSYGEVIREFRYELMSPTDYSVKAIMGSPVSAADAPGAGQVRGLWVNDAGTITYVDIDLSQGSGYTPLIVSIPFGDLTITRRGPMDETQLSTALSLAALRALPKSGSSH